MKHRDSQTYRERFIDDALLVLCAALVGAVIGMFITLGIVIYCS